MTIPTLTPGHGWRGPTDPAPWSGTPGPRPIARWVTVPWQLITDQLTVGIVAGHLDGIREVVLNVEAGPWTPASLEDGIWQATVARGGRPDGMVEVRAIVRGNTGPARVLQGPVHVPGDDFNDHALPVVFGTEPQTLHVGPSGDARDIAGALAILARRPGGDASGCRIVLDHGGTYAWGPYSGPPVVTPGAWLTIIAYGAQIAGTGAGGVPVRRIRLVGGTADNTMLRGEPADRVGDLWMEDVIWDGGDAPVRSVATGYERAYATGCIIRQAQNALPGFTLVRGCALQDVTADALVGIPCVHAVRVERQGSAGGSHADCIGYVSPHGGVRNVVVERVSGIDVDCQQLYVTEPVDGMLVRDVSIARPAGSTTQNSSQFGARIDHLVMERVRLPDQTLNVRGPAPTNARVTDSHFKAIKTTNPATITGLDGVWWEGVTVADAASWATYRPASVPVPAPPPDPDPVEPPVAEPPVVETPVVEEPPVPPPTDPDSLEDRVAVLERESDDLSVIVDELGHRLAAVEAWRAS